MFISDAWAQASTPGSGDFLMSPLLVVIMFVLLYFTMIRPQTKRAKEQKAMIDALQKGDEVIAGGGLVGKITRLDQNYVTLQIASGVEIQVQRPAVQLLLPKGTIKSIE